MSVNQAGNNNIGTKKDQFINTAKDVVKDRVLSTTKDSFIISPVVKGSTALALGYGLKKGLSGQSWKAMDSLQKNRTLRKAVLNYALPVYALSGVASDIVVPNVRMQKLHNKELGSNPSVKDYAKLSAVKGIPSALYFGMMLKNKGKLADSMVDIVKNVPKVIGKTSWGDKKKAVKVIGGGLAAGGALKAVGDVGDFVQLTQTPETIIKSKKNKISNTDFKQATEIVDEVFEKIAAFQSEEDKIADEIISYGFERIASNQSILKGVGDVLTGKNIKNAKGILNGAKSHSKSINHVLAAFDKPNDSLKNVTDSMLGEAKLNYGKEIAKTVGSYGAIGGGAYLGYRAHEDKSKGKLKSQEGDFYPQYNFEKKREH
ncbi:MAG: hypothetical protein K0R00_126 [Herbinix sp.]|jgi:hypothetical protein|nr:hypothetical protein [Herbinix sp.]